MQRGVIAGSRLQGSFVRPNSIVEKSVSLGWTGLGALSLPGSGSSSGAVRLVEPRSGIRTSGQIWRAAADRMMCHRRANHETLKRSSGPRAESESSARGSAGRGSETMAGRSARGCRAYELRWCCCACCAVLCALCVRSDFGQARHRHAPGEETKRVQGMGDMTARRGCVVGER